VGVVEGPDVTVIAQKGQKGAFEFGLRIVIRGEIDIVVVVGGAGVATIATA